MWNLKKKPINEFKNTGTDSQIQRTVSGSQWGEKKGRKGKIWEGD